MNANFKLITRATLIDCLTILLDLLGSMHMGNRINKKIENENIFKTLGGTLGDSGRIV